MTGNPLPTLEEIQQEKIQQVVDSKLRLISQLIFTSLNNDGKPDKSAVFVGGLDPDITRTLQKRCADQGYATAAVISQARDSLYVFLDKAAAKEADKYRKWDGHRIDYFMIPASMAMGEDVNDR